MRIDESLANRIYDLLIAECEASEFMRQSFIMEMAKPSSRKEFRFIGSLGFGGKFRDDNGRLYIDCYPEDATPERAAIISKVNTTLTELVFLGTL